MKPSAWIALALYTFIGFASAQEKPATKETPEPPKLTSTEVIALHSLVVEKQRILQEDAQLQQEFHAIEVDVKNSHPGFQLDPENPLSGRLTPVPAPIPVKK